MMVVYYIAAHMPLLNQLCSCTEVMGGAHNINVIIDHFAPW